MTGCAPRLNFAGGWCNLNMKKLECDWSGKGYAMKNDASHTAVTATAGDLPLAGVRVLDMGHTVMGPSCGMVLADLGADVIKVEPLEGDRTRSNVGFGAGLFWAFNRNKRSIALDIKADAGKALMFRLVAGADVLVENFGYGTMERLGYGYAVLSKLNPRLIYCSLKGFLNGPYEKRPALDEVVQFMGGLAYMTGPSGRPLRAGSSVVDIMGGVFGVIGVQAALRERERTGRGQEVKSALFESTAFLVAQHMSGQMIAGVAPPPMPEKESSWAIYETFATADDKMIFVAITSDNHWRRYCRQFGLDDLLADPALQSNPQRALARSRLAPIVAGITKDHTYADMAAKLEALDIPYAPLSRPSDLFDDPHLNHGDSMLEIEFPNGKRAKLPSIPLSMGSHKRTIRHQPPHKGQHTREILAEAGYTSAEIDEMIRQKIVIAADASGA
jgi:crotonobetainyl-CoA:carnitine CoA-transferase CaiB-like acyl-CoA transferase